MKIRMTVGMIVQIISRSVWWDTVEVLRSEFLSSWKKTIITVREIPLPEAWIKKINSLDLTLDCFFLKTDDYNAPTVRELYDVVNYIDDQIIKRKPVVVHCAAGKGRTGTVLAAYLIKKNSIKPKEAIERIRSLRPGSIQSKKQEITIDSFYNDLYKDNHIK